MGFIPRRFWDSKMYCILQITQIFIQKMFWNKWNSTNCNNLHQRINEEELIFCCFLRFENSNYILDISIISLNKSAYGISI